MKLSIAFLLVFTATTLCAAQEAVPDARAELDHGARLYREGNYVEAQRHFERALELDPMLKNGPLLIARAIERQYKPGDSTPVNMAKGVAAVEAFKRIAESDPSVEEAYNAVISLYRQMKDEQAERDWLTQYSNAPQVMPEKRAVAYLALASKQWDCSYAITEKNKETVRERNRVGIRYRMPESRADFETARGCATEGVNLMERAVSLDANNPDIWAQTANLLRELSKLAEMEGDEARKAEHEGRLKEALAAHQRLTAGRKQASSAERAATSPAPAPAQPKDVIISGGMLNNKAVSKPQPAYPAEALAARAQGTVTVRIVVDETGKVLSAEAVSGHPLLKPAAVAAARQARFTPTSLQGQPVKVKGVITYKFVLQ